MFKTQGTYYKVLIGGSAYHQCQSKEEALQVAIKHSVGKEKFTCIPVYKVVGYAEYSEKCGVEIVTKKTVTETLALMVNAREDLEKSSGGWIDYE